MYNWLADLWDRPRQEKRRHFPRYNGDYERKVTVVNRTWQS